LTTANKTKVSIYLKKKTNGLDTELCQMTVLKCLHL